MKVVTKILDVSKWNLVPEVDVKEYGITGVIIRAGYGAGNYDPKADGWYGWAKEHGLDIGAYWFSYAKDIAGAEKEADYLIRWAKFRDITLPLVYDRENDSVKNSGRKIDLENSMAGHFLQKIEDAGYYAMLYSNKDWKDNVWKPNLLKRFDMWYARYGISDSKLKSECPRVHLHQYTTQFKFGSTTYSQDVNNDYLGLADLIKSKGLTGKK